MTIAAHIQTLITLINGAPAPPLEMVYREWRFRPCPNCRYRLLPPEDSDATRLMFTRPARLELVCADTVAFRNETTGRRGRRRRSDRYPGLEALVVLTGLLYGMTLERIRGSAFIREEEWYDALVRQLILQPCPVVVTPASIPPHVWDPRTGITVPRFLADPSCKMATLAFQLDHLFRLYKPANGMLAWAPRGREVRQMRYVLKLARMKAMQAVYGSLRASQKRQTRYRVDAVRRYRSTEKSNRGGGGPLLEERFEEVSELAGYTRRALSNDLALFRSKVALAVADSGNNKRRDVIKRQENAAHLNQISMEEIVESQVSGLSRISVNAVSFRDMSIKQRPVPR